MSTSTIDQNLHAFFSAEDFPEPEQASEQVPEQESEQVPEQAPYEEAPYEDAEEAEDIEEAAEAEAPAAVEETPVELTEQDEQQAETDDEDGAQEGGDASYSDDEDLYAPAPTMLSALLRSETSNKNIADILAGIDESLRTLVTWVTQPQQE
jgi:hypothetical protein